MDDLKKQFREDLKAIYTLNEIDAVFNLVMNYYCGTSNLDLLLGKKEILTEHEALKLHQGLARLKKHEPVQYIIGETIFYGCRIKVNNKVLIPRPETEELVDWVTGEINNHPKRNEKKITILDIGTGSGCIAVALKKNIPGASLWAMDVARDALEVAEENANLNGVEINFFYDDIFTPSHETRQFDIIVSNPPYIHPGEKHGMRKNILEYEPHLALFTSVNDALEYYVAIIKFAKMHLIIPGKVYFEINENASYDILGILSEFGFSRQVLKKDLSGKNRMISAILHEVQD